VSDSPKAEPCKPVEPTVKKSWRPGSNIQAWLQGRSTPTTTKFEIPNPEPIKTDVAGKPIPIKTDVVAKPIEKSDVVLTDEARKMQKLEEYLAAQNKIAERQLAERADRQGFSTSRPSISFGPGPEPKKPDPAPLAIPGAGKDDRAVILPPMPKD